MNTVTVLEKRKTIMEDFGIVSHHEKYSYSIRKEKYCNGSFTQFH
jgi:hypothetical protein